MSRTDQERVTVTIEGNGETIALGVFDLFEGGAAKAEATKHRPGGMGPEESLGGPVSRDDFTLQRLYKLERDHGYAKRLDRMVGIGIVTAKRVMLNTDRSPFSGDPLTFTGTLVGFVHPDHDSNSADKKMVALEVSADEPIS
jgi:hypothetical protein